MAVQPFPRLPEELVKLVFECACEPVSLKASSTVPADVSTLLSLVLVSRATYNLLIPRLYRTVTISKPSQLIAFTSTLLHRPSLGLLVRHLYVGVVDAPLHNLPVIIGNNLSFSQAAQNHIIRHKKRKEREAHEHEGDTSAMSDVVSYQQCSEVVYLEEGVEFAAMQVQSKPTQMAQFRPPPLAEYEVEDWHHPNAWSANSSIPFGGFGVDRESAGYDAAGDWIGMDEWMLRCIELQNMAEFHWEWIAVTSPMKEIDTTGDEEAKALDPMDWADAREAPAPLPSILRMDQGSPSTSMSTSPSMPYRLGFDHLIRFSILRQRGHSPRSAALILMENYLRKSGQIELQHSNLDLLQDSTETDHFAHPALYARSGAVELLLGCEPPEGENAPPNAIPASSAVFSAFGGPAYDSDDGSDSEDEVTTIHHANGHHVSLEGRQRERERNVLDFADLFGHVSHDSRSLYAGALDQPLDDTRNNMTTGMPLSPGLAECLLQEQRAWGTPLPTLGSLIATLRACLSFCPRVRVLGLNGFLERVVGGTKECVGLSELRHLSLGPPPPFWSSALHLHQKTLSSVRSLHISGCMLYRSEAMAIGGYTSALCNLREIDWTLWLGHVVEHPITAIDALSYMLGHGPANANSSSSQIDAVKRKRPLKSVRASLNAADVAFWQQNAKEEAKRDTRLTLQECSIKEEQDANLRSVRDWWERKAGIR